MDFPGSLGDISGLNIDMDALKNPNADAASSTVQLKMELRTLYSRLGDIEHQLNLSRRELQESKVCFFATEIYSLIFYVSYPCVFSPLEHEFIPLRFFSNITLFGMNRDN